MPLSRLELAPVRDQPADEVRLICFDGDQAVLVSLSRALLSDVVREREWGPIDHNFLVDINRPSLLPLIEVRYRNGQATSHVETRTGRSNPIIELTRSDLEQGLKGYPVSRGFGISAEALGSVGAPPPGSQLDPMSAE